MSREALAAGIEAETAARKLPPKQRVAQVVAATLRQLAREDRNPENADLAVAYAAALLKAAEA